MLKNNLSTKSSAIFLIMALTSSCSEIKRHQIESQYEEKNDEISKRYDGDIDRLQEKCNYYKNAAGVSDVVGFTDMTAYVEYNKCESKLLEMAQKRMAEQIEVSEWKDSEFKKEGILVNQ